MQEIPDDAERIIAVCREQTVRLSSERIDLPSVPPHMLDPNLWMANTPGSTVFMPMADASEQVLGLLVMLVDNGYVVMNEASCPPYHPDMRAAARAYVHRKFGRGGTYDLASPGPWKDSEGVKRTVTPFTEDRTECMGEIAQYIYEKHGKFPGTITTMVLPGFVQAHHIDTSFYDAHYQPGAYLESHARHTETWHPHERGS